jgi:hypothetical protein
MFKNALLTCAILPSITLCSAAPPLSDRSWYEWLKAVDPALTETIIQECGLGIGGFLGAFVGCIFHSWGCYNDADEMNKACHKKCYGGWPADGVYDLQLIHVCEDCCDDVADGDYVNCGLSCGTDRPEAEGYKPCWEDVHQPAPLPPDVSPGDE